VYAQCVQLGMPRSRSIALEGRLMNCLHGLPLQLRELVSSLPAGTPIVLFCLDNSSFL
jgi:hypothetical protein